MEQDRFPIRSNGLGDLPGGRFLVLVIALAGLFVFWQSNLREVPFAPGARQFNTLSVADEIRLGEQAYLQILQQEQARGNRILCTGREGCSTDERRMVEAVRAVGRRLEAAAIELEEDYLRRGYRMPGVAGRFDWTYHVIESAQPNAFCLPGGYVAIYTGMLDITGNNDGRAGPEDIAGEDLLAVVMGHEIGHALAHHGAARMSTGRVIQIGQTALAIGLGDMEPGQHAALMQAFGIAAQGGVLAFSREHEAQADRIGLDLLVRACFDPRRAPELWERMAGLGGPRPPEWMSTHPASERRAQNFREWMPDAIAEFERRCL